MNKDFYKNIIASSVAGTKGYPGSNYEAIWFDISRYEDGTFEARAKYSSGINKRILEEHCGTFARARGNSISEAIEGIREDVLAWNVKAISASEIRSALRDCKIEGYDYIEDNSKWILGDTPKVDGMYWVVIIIEGEKLVSFLKFSGNTWNIHLTILAYKPCVVPAVPDIF